MESKLNNFYVVEFKDNSLDVIPSGWISENKKSCRFPPSLKGINPKLRATPGSKPLSNWPSHEIIIHLSKDDFIDCVKRRKRLIDYISNPESVLETDDGVHGVKKRRTRKRKIIFSPCIPGKRQVRNPQTKQSLASSSSDSEDLSADSPIHFATQSLKPLFADPKLKFTGSSAKERIGTPSEDGSDFRESELDENEGGRREDSSYRNSIGEAPNSGAETSEAEISDPNSPDANDSDAVNGASGTEDPRTDLLTLGRGGGSEAVGDSTSLETFIREFRRFQREIFGEIHTIKGDIEVIRAQVSKTRSNANECPFRIPLNSIEDLQEVTEKLKDKLIRESLFKWCCCIGGVEFKTHARRILSRIFTNDFAAKINLSGKNGKIKLNGLHLTAQIIASVVSSHETTASEVEEVIKNWLKGSKDRDGGRARRTRRTRVAVL